MGSLVNNQGHGEVSEAQEREGRCEGPRRLKEEEREVYLWLVSRHPPCLHPAPGALVLGVAVFPCRLGYAKVRDLYRWRHFTSCAQLSLATQLTQSPSPGRRDGCLAFLWSCRVELVNRKLTWPFHIGSDH